MKVVLVGVNHAGTSFVRTLKTLNKNIEIKAYDRNKDISFLGCGIALWVGGEFTSPDGLFYANTEILEKEFGTKVQVEHDVIEINSKDKYVVVKNLATGETFKDSYDKLVFAGGTWPISLGIEGEKLENVYFSKLFAHAQEIYQCNRNDELKNVVVVGAGYIGVELVEAFNKAGKNVTLIDFADRVVPNYFDEEFTSEMEKRMHSDGITFQSQEALVKIEGENGKVTKVITNKGEYKADMVIMSVGFKPQTQLLDKQVDVIKNGAILVNEFQQSSDPDIYAIGDSCALKHNILGHANVALATNAVKTGIVAAFHLNGNTSIKFPGVNGTNGISVFGCKYASTGISMHAAKKFGINAKSTIVRDKDRPEFMTTAEDVMFKLVYDPNNMKILGAQIGSWGKANHTEIIYELSLAISEGLTVPELALVDVFFLPHFNKPFNFIIKAVLDTIGLNYADNN